MTGRRREGPNDRPLRRDRVCKIAAAEAADAALRRQGEEGTLRYADALKAAGYYQLKTAQALQNGAAINARMSIPPLQP